MCYIADIEAPDAGQNVCAAVRTDSAGALQRLALVDVTFSFGKNHLPGHIAADIIRQTAASERNFSAAESITAGIMGGVRNMTSFGAIYMCGAKMCHVTTGDRVIGIVRDGKMVHGFRLGCIYNKGYCERIYHCTVRLRKNDTVLMYGSDIFDSDVSSYICSLVSMNIKRRSMGAAYKSNAEILDDIRCVLGLKGNRQVHSTLTLITCVGDV